MITSFKFDRTSRTFICSSIGGPTTNILWRKGERHLTGNPYLQSQMILDTSLALYENSLTIMGDVEVSGLYSCTVGNSRGNSSAELLVPGKCLSCHKQTFNTRCWRKEGNIYKLLYDELHYNCYLHTSQGLNNAKSETLLNCE